MKVLHAISRGLAVLGLLGAAGAASAQGRGPDVVYILLDDVGFADLGAYGSEIATPNIDRLAAAGLRFNQFHTKAVCSPTRASLLTGRNNQSVGMMDLPGDRGHAHSRGFITPRAATIAQILRASGYATSMVGKWHLTPPPEMHDSARTRVNWPLGKGFEKFYGFLSGWTDQYRPRGVGRELVEGNRAIAPPETPGFHLSEAMVDRAIDYLGAEFTSERGRPVFQYVAFGAAHAPIQVPRAYVDRYVPVYAQGWDRIREQRFARQKALGIVPADAVLPPRNPGDPAWDGLSAEEKTVFARFMATYAGFLEHTDAQIGRLVDFLKASGRFENTLIFLMSDNGAAPEAGTKGGFARPYGDTTTVPQMLARLDDLGTERSQALYQRPWAMAGNTPFRMYKLWPYAGGVRDPLIVSWPAMIRDGGSIRSQFVDVIDVTPTVLDALGVPAPAVFEGVPQMAMHGRSILPTFRDRSAPDPRVTQFFVLRGNRSIVHDGWKAVAIHQNGTSFEEDRWELYDLRRDPTESHDLASRNPRKLKELQALWWSEATRYGALPLVEFGRP